MTRAGAPGRADAELKGTAGVVLVMGSAVVVASEFVVIGLAPELARNLGAPLAQTGWLVASFAIGSAVFGPLAAYAARSLRADRAMAIALAPFAASVLLGFADALWQVGVLRLIQGAALPLFIGVATEAFGGGREGPDKAIARVYLGVLAGSVLAGPAGAALSDLWGWRFPAVGLGVLAAMTAIAILASGRFATVTASPDRGSGDLALFRRGPAVVQLAVSFILFAAMFCGYAYLAGILEASGIAPRAVGPWLLVFGMAGLVGNALAGKATLWGLGRSTAAVAAVLLGAATLLPFLGVSSLLLAPILAVWGAAHAAAFVICQLRVSLISPHAPRLAAALNISAANFGIGAGSALGGLALKTGGVAGVSMTAALLASAGLLLSFYRAPHPVSRRRFEQPRP